MGRWGPHSPLPLSPLAYFLGLFHESFKQPPSALVEELMLALILLCFHLYLPAGLPAVSSSLLPFSTPSLPLFLFSVE